MANPFYNFILKMLPGRPARAEDVNEQLEAIETGFDLVDSALGDKIDQDFTPPASRAQNLLGFDDVGDPIAVGGDTASRANKFVGWDADGEFKVALPVPPPPPPDSPGIQWQGDWLAGATYEPLDAVHHDGSAWIAPDGADPGQEPGVHPNWELLAEHGDVGIQWQGEWLIGATYVARDAVEHEGSAWISPAGSPPGAEPGVDPSWDLLASKGDQGDPGAGLIAGGTARQVIIKQSATDFDADWELIGIDSLSTASTGFNAALFRDGSNDFGLLIPGGSDQLKVIATDGSNLFGLTKIQTDHIEDDAVNRFKIGDEEIRDIHIPLNEIPLNRLQGSSSAPATQIFQDPAAPNNDTIGAIFDIGNKQFGKLRPPMDGSNQFLPTVLVARLDTELPQENVYEFRQVSEDFITDQAVTYAKIQNVNANRLLGRIGSIGTAQEISAGMGLKLVSGALQSDRFMLTASRDTSTASDENNAVVISWGFSQAGDNSGVQFEAHEGGIVWRFPLTDLAAIYHITLSAIISGGSETDQSIRAFQVDDDITLFTMQGELGADGTLSYNESFAGGVLNPSADPDIALGVEINPSGAPAGFTVDRISFLIERLN